MKKDYLYRVKEIPNQIPEELQDGIEVDEVIKVTKITNQKMNGDWYFSAITIFMYNPRELDSLLEYGPDDDWFLPIKDTKPESDDNYFIFTEIGHVDDCVEYKLWKLNKVIL